MAAKFGIRKQLARSLAGPPGDQIVKLEHMVLSDGRKLVEVWPEATMFDREGEALRFVSIPEGSNGQVFVEYGSGEDRGVSLYQFYQNGEADFYMGLGTASKKR